MKREQSPEPPSLESGSSDSKSSPTPSSPSLSPSEQGLSASSESKGSAPKVTASLTSFEERERLRQEALTKATDTASFALRTGRIAKEGAGWLKGRVEELVESYQAQSRFFKYRAWIAALWLVFTASSAALALWPTNTMGARVGTAPDPADGSVIISLENESEKLWRGVVIVLDGGYEHRIKELPPGQRVQIHAHRFKRRSGANVVHDNPPRQYKPQTINISTKGQGAYTAKLEP